MEDRPDAAEPAITPDDLERERLRTYLDWAEVRAPVWYWPAYALAITAWIVGYGLGTLWGLAGALMVVAVAVVGIREMASRGQVAMPRFRGMPARLKRAWVPAGVAALWLVGVLLFTLTVEAPPRTLLGVLTGLIMGLAGAWTSRRYRIEARRLADETGIAR